MERKIGLEYEFLAIQIENGQAVTRDVMKAIWRTWTEEFHVDIVIDKATKQPVGVLYCREGHEDVLINTDAGINVVEFGLMPFSSIEECNRDMQDVVSEFLSVSRQHDVDLLGYGIQPKTPHFYPDLKTEKIWYRGFLRFPGLAKGHHLFHNIAAHQPCIDVSPDEALNALNTLNAISGVTIALFANSGFGEGEKQCCHEEREHRWNRWGNESGEPVQFCGMVKQPYVSIADYIQQSWNIPVRAIHQHNTLYSVGTGTTVSAYMKGEDWEALDLATGEKAYVSPTIEDVNTLGQYNWIEARLKFEFESATPLENIISAVRNGDVDDLLKRYVKKLYIEKRNIACQSWDDRLVAPSFILGIIENLESAVEIMNSKPWEYWIGLREKTIIKSMEVDEVVPLAQKLIEIAEVGLKKRGLGEEKYLAPLYERTEKRQSPAMKAIEDFNEMGMEKFIESRIIGV